MRRAGLLALAMFLTLARAAPARGEGPGAGAPGVPPSEVRGPGPGLAAGASPESSAPPTAPVSAESVAGESLGGPDGTPPASTLGTAGFRVLGALAVVGVLLTLTLLVLQRLFRQGGGTGALSRLRRSPGGWLSRWMPAPPPAADRLEILERSYVGARESVCIVRAGAERFLIGVTASRICLLGRLEPVREVADPAEEPAAADFARAVSGTVAPRPGPAEGAFQALLARSRERLTRLGIDSVHAGARRE